MSLLENLVSALRGARQSISEIDARLAELAVEEDRLVNLPPDVSAIREWLGRGLAAQADAYVATLRSWYGGFTASGGWIDNDSRANLLALPKSRPAGDRTAAPVNWLTAPAADAGLLALSYFLKNIIAERVPDIAALLAPDAPDAISNEVRGKRLGKIRAERTRLETERAELLAELTAARVEAGA